jgi:predicted RNA binding protein YcfA (HicA-like mRNA interferase family)
MPPLPSLSGSDVVRVLEALGWEVARQRGSHIVLVRSGSLATLSVPNHRIVAKGTLRSLIRAADLTVSEFAQVAEQL